MIVSSSSIPSAARGLVVMLVLVAGVQAQWRTLDGTLNNHVHLDWGAAQTALMRTATAAYGDGLATPAGAGRPSARAVSNAVVAELEAIPDGTGASSMLWQWGQFLDHDIDLTEAAVPAEAFDIAVPMGDPWFDPDGSGSMVIPMERSVYALDGAGVRQQLNVITAWIDASNVYGSSLQRAKALAGPDGRLRTSPGGLLPFNTQGLPNAPTADDPAYFLAGDVRANEQVGLTALHTLFVREHNRVADLLADMAMVDSDPLVLYMATRAVVGAELQCITYNEFLPLLLGEDALPPYVGYRPNVDASIANEFSTAAYRVGHTMLPDELPRLDADLQPVPAGPLPLAEAFFAPEEILSEGIDSVLRGLCHQPARAIDTQLTDAVRNFLFGPPGAGGFDLAALNIQRGRDHGLPSYNQLRQDMGLAPAAGFADITSDAETAQRLASVYATPDDVDAWVGGLAEDHVPGAMVGELFHRILVDQFTRLRDGDIYWYERYLPHAVVVAVEELSLASIIRLNTGVGAEIPDDVFRMP